MMLPLDQIQTYDQLRFFIHNRLCEKENLLQDQFQMSEYPLMKRHRQCGVQFTLQGPRNVRLGGIWAFDHNMLYFYDACGIRFEKIQLKNRIFNYESPSVETAAA